mmetsp:Transcript_35491/g.114080  ORF Transcript_35491/g.114080 Transcript_35491/m.114080 type:complete len:280 (+) Transcript_35491:273-1112(+)
MGRATPPPPAFPTMHVDNTNSTRKVRASCLQRRPPRSQLALLPLHDAQLDLRPEGADQPLHWPRGGVTQRADGVALDLVRQLLEHVNLLDLRVARHKPVHDLAHPASPLAARRALAARLVLVKLGEACDGGDDVGLLVEDGDGGGAEARAGALQVVEVHEHLVADVRRQDRHRRAAWDDAQQVVPPSNHVLAVLLQQLLERDGHLLLDRAGVVDVARDAKQLCARVVLPPEGREPVGAAPHDRRRHRDRLHVSNRGRAAVEAGVCREGRLEAGLARLAL